jgi:hypothetical protein
MYKANFSSSLIYLREVITQLKLINVVFCRGFSWRWCRSHVEVLTLCSQTEPKIPLALIAIPVLPEVRGLSLEHRYM